MKNNVAKNFAKYRLAKKERPVIKFADFNFKLAVINILMYEKELLTPQFELNEFVDLYKERTIDIEQEGYAIIPEVRQYFADLEVEQSLAGEINEIVQDGGDDIYHQLYPFWDGECDTFDILSIEDIGHFPNLKEVAFWGDKHEYFREKLAAKGIQIRECY